MQSVRSYIWLNTEVTAEFPTRRAMRHAARPPKKRIHPVGWVAISLGVVAIALIGWVGIRGLIAKDALESALPLVSQIKDDLSGADLAAAQTTIDSVAQKTATAKSMTSDPVWHAAESIPMLGDNLRVFRELAEITDDITVNVMLPVASLGDVLNPDTLKPVDGKIDVSLFEGAIPVVEEAVAALGARYADVQAVDTAGTLGPVADAQQRLEKMLKPIVPLAEQAVTVVRQVPALLGADQKRNYLMVFQNNSESRALGGHAGSWVLISVDDGKIDLAQQSTVHDLDRTTQPVIPLGADVLSIWPGAATNPANTTAVPRLSVAADTARAFWNNKFGVQSDAVIFIDPVALGYVLAAVGDIELPTGDVITSENAADFLLNGVYLKYPLNDDQDAIFGTIAKDVFGAITGGKFNPGKLVEGAMKAGREHRLLLWFFNEDENAAFKSLPFSLDTPAFNDDVATFGVYLQDNLGSKMTYYVAEKVELGQAQCAAGGSQYQVKVTITNTVKPEDGPNLPSYVGRLNGGNFRVLLTIYAPPGSKFISLDGGDSDYIVGNGFDGEYPVMIQRMTLVPGQTATATFTLTPPDDKPDRDLKAYATPLATKVPVTDFEFTC
jgi:hypothetical protein